MAARARVKDYHRPTENAVAFVARAVLPTFYRVARSPSQRATDAFRMHARLQGLHRNMFLGCQLACRPARTAPSSSSSPPIRISTHNRIRLVITYIHTYIYIFMYLNTSRYLYTRTHTHTHANIRVSDVCARVKYVSAYFLSVPCFPFFYSYVVAGNSKTYCTALPRS